MMTKDYRKGVEDYLKVSAIWLVEQVAVLKNCIRAAKHAEEDMKCLRIQVASNKAQARLHERLISRVKKEMRKYRSMLAADARKRAKAAKVAK